MPLLKPNMGRALSAIGAIVLIFALFMVWYHIDRAANADTTGWQTFTNLRIVVLLGAVLTLLSAAVVQTRMVLIARTVLGVVLAALILRRIIFPPDLADPVSAQVGVYVGLVGALCVAAGGLVDTGRRVVEIYPGLRRAPVAELGRGQDALDAGDDPPRR
jgi:peptidoglycan/LPS O-acetylase OafA/YrhL